jgi:hypothetical protein
MKLSIRILSVYLFLSFCLAQFVLAGEKLFPFYLASQTKGDMANVITATKSKLQNAGFDIVGEYSPYQTAHIIIVSNAELIANATASKNGGYGAVQRISVTDVNGDIQLAYTNPIYMSYAYQLNGHLENIENTLKTTLGFIKSYGSEKGMEAEDIKGYHYMFGMPYFDEPVEIADHGSYENAIKMLESGLASKKGGVSKVYKVELNGKGAVYGVAMSKDMSSDQTIMKEIDFKEVRSTPQLPYEMIVTENGKIYILDARFRIAINFPDLSMAGSNSFMGIMSSPDAIVTAIKKAAKAKTSSDDF